MISHRYAVLVAGLVACAGCSAPPPPAPLVSPPPPPPALEPEMKVHDATVDVLSGLTTEIKIDGKSVGTTPVSGYKLAPGRHDVTFMFADGPATESVEIEAGDHKTVKLDPPPSANEEMKPPEPPKKK